MKLAVLAHIMRIELLLQSEPIEMLQDIEAGKKTEVDLFGGAICALGGKYGIPTPQNAMFLKLIKALEEIPM